MATFGVTFVTEKDSMELGERLRKGTKHLIYLNRKRGSSTGTKRRGVKAQSDIFTTENTQSVVLWDEDSDDEEIIQVTMLDDVTNSNAYKKCAAMEYSFAGEDAERMKERQDIMKAEETAIKEILLHTAAEIVDDLICCAVRNSSSQADSEADRIGEILDEEPTLPKKGWRKFLCGCCACVTNADQQKKKGPGIVNRLRRLFKL